VEVTRRSGGAWCCRRGKSGRDQVVWQIGCARRSIVKFRPAAQVGGRRAWNRREHGRGVSGEVLGGVCHGAGYEQSEIPSRQMLMEGETPHGKVREQ